MFERIVENLRHTSLEIPINIINFEVSNLTSDFRGAYKTDMGNGRYLYRSKPQLISTRNIPKYILDRFGFTDYSVSRKGLKVQCFRTKNAFGSEIPDQNGVFSTVCLYSNFNGKNLYLDYSVTQDHLGKYNISAGISGNDVERITGEDFRFQSISPEDLRPQDRVSFREALMISNILLAIRQNTEFEP